MEGNKVLREKDKVPKTRVKQEHYILQAKEHLREASPPELSTPFQTPAQPSGSVQMQTFWRSLPQVL